jgi:glycosyltransferase involved in cell wall biosynthesis
VSIVTVGRICPQKDPTWYLQAFQAYRGERHWVWVGGASSDDERAMADQAALEAAGVVVTGWLDRAAVFNWLKRAHVYVHTAAWEGNPMTLYEAAAQGLPVLARDIPAVRAEGIQHLMNSPEHLARWVEQLDDEYQWRRAALYTCRWVTERMQRDQREALLKVYGL